MTRIDDALGPTAPPGTEQIAALGLFVRAYTMQRVLTGQVVSTTEQELAAYIAGIDAETRARLLADALEVLAISAAARAAALGMLASLDPIGGTGPVDYDDVQYGVSRQALAAGDTVFNNGVRGNGASLMRVRGPQCEGVTYAAGDPASSTKASRAVTEGSANFPSGCVGDVCATTQGKLAPAVLGVIRGSSVIDTGNAAQSFATTHTEVGYDIRGTIVSPTCNSCAAALGQRCVNNVCVQHAILKANSIPVFTGMNFWDTFSPELIFTRHTDNARISVKAQVDIDDLDPIVGQTPADDILRCHANPVDPNMVSSPEALVERMIPRGPLPDTITAGHFYTVQAKNINGTYYRFGELVDLTPDLRFERGRTIHVCRPPACSPSPSPTQAACTLLNVPSIAQCGAAAGGIWNTPPRSIQQCQQTFGTNYVAAQCPETPPDMISDPDTTGRGTVVFVSDPEPETFVQTQLAATWCKDETGGDALGADELMVWMGAVGDVPAWENLEELEDQFGFYLDDDSDVDEKKRPNPPKLMSALRVPFRDRGDAAVVVRVGEDDDFDWEHALVGIVTAIPAAFGGAEAGKALLGPEAAAGGAAAGAVSGFLAGVAVALQIWPNPDDEIGQTAWMLKVNDISAKALLARDNSISPGRDPMPGVDPEPLASMTEMNLNKHLNSRRSTKHPGVDTQGYLRNEDILTCANNAACAAGKVCTFGACVPQAWSDRTIPKGTFNPAVDVPGVIELVHLDGEGEYVLYIATSLSDEGQ